MSSVLYTTRRERYETVLVHCVSPSVSEKSKLRPYTAEEKEDKEQKDKDGDREEAQQ